MPVGVRYDYLQILSGAVISTRNGSGHWEGNERTGIDLATNEAKARLSASQRMLAPVRHILPLTSISRQRLLPAAGRVLVRKGQNVQTSDIIAECDLSSRHLWLDIAAGLRLAPDKADNYLQRAPGDLVSQGDILAGPVGWTKRVVRVPENGKVILTGRGKVLLAIEGKPYQIMAGMPGEVTSLIPGRGAVIETVGALIQGIWGNGLIDSGTLRVLIDRPEEILLPERLNEQLSQKIVLAGFCGDAEVLLTAARIPIRGLILASMSSSLVPVAQQLSYPVIVLEGFGLLPMSSAAFRLLTSNAGRQVSLNACDPQCSQNQRPEIVIPLPAERHPPQPPETSVFRPGQRVYIVRAPNQAQIGQIVNIRSDLYRFPSGIRAKAADINLENGMRAILPLANLEVLD